MKTRILRGGVFGVAYILAEGIGGLALAGILVSRAGADVAGIWLLLMSLYPIVQGAQGALGTIVTRRTAALTPTGEWHPRITGGVREAYLVGALAFVVVMSAVYYVYLRQVVPSGLLRSALECTVLVTAGMACRLYGSFRFHLLNGIGAVGWDKLALFACSIGFFGVALLLVMSGRSLPSVGLAYLTWSVVYLWAGRRTVRRISAGQKGTAALPWVALRGARSILVASFPMAIVGASGFLVMNSDIFVVGLVSNIETVSYFSIQARSALLVVASCALIPQLTFPFIARQWAVGGARTSRSLYVRVSLLTLSLAIALSLVLLAGVPPFMTRAFGEHAFLGYPMYLLQLTFTVLSINTISQGLCGLATGMSNFVDLAVLNVLISLPLSIGFGVLFGTLGVVLGNVLGAIPATALHTRRARRIFSFAGEGLFDVLQSSRLPNPTTGGG